MKKAGIVVFAFGARENIPPNQLLADIASRRALRFKAQVYAQRDIPLKHAANVEYVEDKNGKPPSTFQIAEGAVGWARRNNLKRIFIVAAKPHLCRCKRDLTLAFQEAKTAVRISVIRKVERLPEERWFCPESIRKCTMYKKNWENREWFVEHVPFWIYKFFSQLR